MFEEISTFYEIFYHFDLDVKGEEFQYYILELSSIDETVLIAIK